MKEPRRPSKLWEQILEDMNHLDVEVHQLFVNETDNGGDEKSSDRSRGLTPAKDIPISCDL
jgi:hypothetical protein